MSKPVKFSYIRKFLSGEIQFGFWGFVSGTVSTVTSFIIITGLSLYEYGVFTLLTATYGFFSNLPLMLKGSAGADLMRYAGAGNKSAAKRILVEMYGVLTIAYIALWALVFFGSGLFVRWYGAEFASLGKIISFLFLTNIANNILTAFLKTDLKFGVIASRRTVQKVIQLIFLGSLFFADSISVKYVLWSMVVGSLGGCIYLVPAAIRSYRPWRHVSLHPKHLWLSNIKAEGKWAIMRRALNDTTSNIQPWLIKFFISTEAVAIFSIAKSLISSIKGLPPVRTVGALINFGISNKDRTRRVVELGTKYYFIISLFLVLGGLLVAPPIIRIFASHYTPSLPYFYVLLAIIPIQALVSLMTYALLSLRRQKFIFIHHVIKIILNISLMLILLPLFGLWGLVVESLVTTTILSVLTYWYVWRHCSEIGLNFRQMITFGKNDVIFIKRAMAHIKDILHSIPLKIANVTRFF